MIPIFFADFFWSVSSKNYTFVLEHPVHNYSETAIPRLFGLIDVVPLTEKGKRSQYTLLTGGKGVS